MGVCCSKPDTEMPHRSRAFINPMYDDYGAQGTYITEVQHNIMSPTEWQGKFDNIR